MTVSRIELRLALAAILIVGAYVAAAYVSAPYFWRHYEHQAGLADLAATTVTAQGIPGDAINIGLEGDEDDVLCAMRDAGWTPADPVTFISALRIAGSVLLDRPYPKAPISPLFYEGRRQDLAFEKASGRSATHRHHVRFWKALAAGEDGHPVWLGAATFDDSVGVSHYTGQITHHVAPDIDAERDSLSADLLAAKKVEATYSVSGVGPTLFGRNGGGDPYFTDGEIAFSKLVSGCGAQEGAPVALAPPARSHVKKVVFGWLAALRRKFL
jgi:LssY C-terminus